MGKKQKRNKKEKNQNEKKKQKEKFFLIGYLFYFLDKKKWPRGLSKNIQAILSI